MAYYRLIAYLGLALFCTTAWLLAAAFLSQLFSRS
jgi:hypothetical protein